MSIMSSCMGIFKRNFIWSSHLVFKCLNQEKYVSFKSFFIGSRMHHDADLLRFRRLLKLWVHTMFTLHQEKSQVNVLIYVDDLIINHDVIKMFKYYISDCFHMKNLGPLKYFLGIEVACAPIKYSWINVNTLSKSF